MFKLVRENIRIAFGSIKSSLLRTILTVLIIAIGITALVGILSAVSALENTMSDNFSSMGANTFNIQRYEFEVRRGGGGERQKINPIISYTDVREFEEKFTFPYTKTSISFVGTRGAEVKFENEKTDPEVTVIGVNEHFIQNSGLKIEDGRELNYFDVTNNNNVCVIGADIRKALFPDDRSVGKIISVRGVKFKVIGELETKGATFGNNQDLRIIVPIQNARSIFTNPRINYALSIMVDKEDMLEGAQEDAIVTFRNIRGLTPVEENNFGLERSDDLINRIGSITGVLGTIAWVISIITIFGSSIALLNMMLVSVTERTREIGVRKALGAKRGTIAFQFFIETIIIGQLGGLLGILLGIGVGYLFAAIVDFIFVIPWVAMLWATGITFFIAVISGSYPASKAARLDPIESLRYE
ncbi:MAG: ABC transporter permease [Bacteroidia bacterium]|nr:ABC transporter permease [Bacteroidia bacterium]NND12074.1 FtsX-like permease family protein [Flavobacteriaceae bacterium]MBT8309748.1 ABC transporter permease [Bacteroidia bacterium]NNK28110.1 FtsX-like permease family protein [Flavobacteriaceae bacterium]NNL60032.1 FtsX-like permease family protein [Flavobacteriaceae bacterium]